MRDFMKNMAIDNLIKGILTSILFIFNVGSMVI